MLKSGAETLRKLDRDGYALLRGVLDHAAVAHWLQLCSDRLDRSGAGVFHRDAEIYAARGVLERMPECRQLGQVEPVASILQHVLGVEVGLVRGLFFDKPPGQSWALPWHRDLKITVQAGGPASSLYSPPRDRFGVLHTEPPRRVLERMLTVRFHLDPMTADNGALEVIPGSHRTVNPVGSGDGGAAPAVTYGEAGDALLMRPLLLHASGRSKPECSLHRRILHLEFAAGEPLPDGWHWHEFQRLFHDDGSVIAA